MGRDRRSMGVSERGARVRFCWFRSFGGRAGGSPLALVLALVLAGCAGGAEDGTGSEGGGNGDDAGDSNAGSCEAAARSPLLRMSRGDYERTLEELLGARAVEAVASALATLPSDEPPDHDGFAREDQRISDRHIEAWYRVADALATFVAADPDARARAFTACAETSSGKDCLRKGAAGLAEAAFRRPLEADELDEIVADALDFSGDQRYHAVLFRVLMAPDFLYHFENRGTIEAGSLRLTGYELAARLSYHFWGTPPDSELRAAARSGRLHDDAGYRAEVERVFASEKTQLTQAEFFSEWLHLDGGGFARSPRLDILRDGIDTDGLAAAMTREVIDALRYHIDVADHAWSDVLRSPSSFARTANLADLYGVSRWDGSSSPPRFPEGERAGLLTRAALLQTADGSTNPFRRGAFVRRALLCDTVAPPPADLPPDALETPETAAGTSTRTAFENKVDAKECAGCHQQFSALGYALEAYDGLGRHRTREWLVSSTGVDHGHAPLDLEVVPRIDSDDERPTRGVAELVERMIDSGKTDACLAETYLRFTQRRGASSADRCRVQALAERISAGASLAEALREVALQPSFRMRALVD